MSSPTNPTRYRFLLPMTIGIMFPNAVRRFQESFYPAGVTTDEWIAGWISFLQTLEVPAEYLHFDNPASIDLEASIELEALGLSPDIGPIWGFKISEDDYVRMLLMAEAPNDRRHRS